MIATTSVKNLINSNLSEFHRDLLWLDGTLHELQAALLGEQAPYINHTHSRLYTTRQEQVAALHQLCDEMERLMPAVISLGGYLPSDPRAMVEMRLELLSEEV